MLACLHKNIQVLFAFVDEVNSVLKKTSGDGLRVSDEVAMKVDYMDVRTR